MMTDDDRCFIKVVFYSFNDYIYIYSSFNDCRRCLSEQPSSPGEFRLGGVTSSDVDTYIVHKIVRISETPMLDT